MHGKGHGDGHEKAGRFLDLRCNRLANSWQTMYSNANEPFCPVYTHSLAPKSHNLKARDLLIDFSHDSRNLLLQFLRLVYEFYPLDNNPLAKSSGKVLDITFEV